MGYFGKKANAVMGRWGWRRIATLSVVVWVMTACGVLPPAGAPSPTLAPEATVILRTAARTVSPPVVTRAADTVTPSPASTRPSARTPIPPATPHYYTVQSGDTLASIAAHFAVSVSALREANADLPPDMLRPGQILLIPPQMSATLAETSALLPTNTPPALELPLPACVITPADEAICLGWVPNRTSSPLAQISVAVVLVDDAGQTVAEQTVTPAQAVLPAGAGAPYSARFPAPPSFATAHALLLGGDVVGGSMPPPAVPLTITESAQAPVDGGVRVSGSAGHTESAPLGDLIVVAALFDETGVITGYRVQRVEGTLPPGETLAVEVVVLPLRVGSSGFNLYVEGRPVR